uniref:Uncharacterized protein n=1 Tax=Anguilla anguilla TaxID=7936 RepID=A0A0E9W3T0_ANGAN
MKNTQSTQNKELKSFVARLCSIKSRVPSMTSLSKLSRSRSRAGMMVTRQQLTLSCSSAHPSLLFGQVCF